MHHLTCNSLSPTTGLEPGECNCQSALTKEADLFDGVVNAIRAVQRQNNLANARKYTRRDIDEALETFRVEFEDDCS